jgi:hypothetical protein
MFMFPEIVGENNEKMSFPIDEFGDDAKHIDVSIVAVGLETIAPENFKPVS